MLPLSIGAICRYSSCKGTFLSSGFSAELCRFGLWSLKVKVVVRTTSTVARGVPRGSFLRFIIF